MTTTPPQLDRSPDADRPVVESGVLPDGSTYVVRAFGHFHHMIDRVVNRTTVWSQMFGRQEDPAGQVAEVVAKMRHHPEAFSRPYCTQCGSALHARAHCPG